MEGVEGGGLGIGPGVRAVAMADGYARATGKVGVASTTCGPGFTQIMTALTIAARGNVPLVVFAGDSPIAAAWYLQQIDMAPLALACGAHYVAVKHLDRLLDNVREAFLVAQNEQRPVVLSVPRSVEVRKVDLALELQILSYHEQRRAGGPMSVVPAASSRSASA